ncbi:MAG TPA: hypothetical protein DD409_10835 [Bacteroidales bacterium]|jgi:hypothetical protein|nr:MAG: Chromosome partition protein Smc [Bacteroidetes bacterium ADurb.Bin416]HBL73304.1 hypothetical protein [Bacteroidales bacterium]
MYNSIEKKMKRVMLAGSASLLPLLFVIMLLPACNRTSDAYKALEQEKDSLLLEEQKKTAELNQMLSVINMIEDNFEQIKTAENYVTFQAGQQEIAQDSIGRIVNDIELIRKTLVDNKSQIENLKNQLASSRKASGEMKRLVARLSAQIEEHVKTITSLQEQLALKDIRIQELDELVMTLGDSISSLQASVSGKESQLTQKDTQLNKVWFVFGTRKELRQQEIFTRNGLLVEGFNKDYFLEDDARTLTEIPLYSKKAKLLTNHPVSSYQFEKVNEFQVLHITDPKKFWEISHYLVIEVD